MVEAVYETRIAHRRQKPVEQQFSLRGYSLFVNVARFDEKPSNLRLLGFGRFGWHAFHRRHFSLLADTRKTALQCAQEYLSARAKVQADRVFLLAHPAIAGYNFNPVSFFFCYSRGQHVATIVEVNNTFGEQKHFLLPGDSLGHRAKKNFYVSPFISPFSDFSLTIPAPDENLRISINTMERNETELFASLAGRRHALSDRNLLFFAVKYPLYTLRVIVLIHYYAFKLFFRGVSHYPKENADAAIIQTELRSER